MSTIKFNFFRFSWKFIFIGQFFILICNFRIIFIVFYCVVYRVVFYNKTLRCMALRRSHFQCGKCEERRSQSSAARTPTLALPPRWARKEFCVVVCTALLTFVCMLRYWMWNVVPIWSLYSSIFMVIRCADPVSVFFDTYRNILYQSDISGQAAQSASIPRMFFPVGWKRQPEEGGIGPGCCGGGVITTWAVGDGVIAAGSAV